MFPNNRPKRLKPQVLNKLPELIYCLIKPGEVLGLPAQHRGGFDTSKRSLIETLIPLMVRFSNILESLPFSLIHLNRAESKAFL